MTVTSGTRELVRAILAYECADGLADRQSIEAIRNGDIEYWMSAIESSALFAPGELRRMRFVFESDPEQLIAVMLEGADELRERRSGSHLRNPQWVSEIASRSHSPGSRATG
ncbi:hypothetical protein [Hoyosella altamirensis]|uniref:Uncharacterized protein n=2 Tax=Hoyosella altamirensis TaxID=616997 RepID=A0A839RJ35_9ACTN|nr:hypothetical protein [Hoyosella altamirensis]MBB3036146.1 hypothetical protein [Hoyosella altamirensis]